MFFLSVAGRIEAETRPSGVMDSFSQCSVSLKTVLFINEPQIEDVEHAMNAQVEIVVCLAESAALEIVTPMPIGNVKAVKGVTKPTIVDGLNISELPTNACCLTANSG